MRNRTRVLGIAVLAVVLMLGMTACDDLFGFKAPTGLTATKLSSGYIHLTWDEKDGWDASDGSRYYELAYRTNLDSSSTRKRITTTSSTAYDHYPSVVTEVTTIYYYLRGHSRNSDYSWSESDWSSEVSIRIK